MISVLVVNDKWTCGESIRLNLEMPEFQQAVYEEFQEPLLVLVAEGENTTSLVDSAIKLVSTTSNTSFCVTVLDMHMDGDIDGSLKFIQRFTRTRSIKELGKILLISDKAYRNDPAVTQLEMQYAAIYKAGGTRYHRQEAVRFAIRMHMTENGRL